jgi:hypothetical protein
MRTLILASLLALGTTWGVGAKAADQDRGTPSCQTAQDENGGQVLTCDNLTNEQSLSVAQDPDARRRCFRVCSFRFGPFCFRYHVECRGWGGGWGGGWGDGGDHGGHHGWH